MFQISDNSQINTNSLVLIGLTALIGLLAALWLRSSAAKNTRIDQLAVEITKLQLDQAVTDTKVTPLWAKAQAALSADLHHPHAKDHEMDDLLEKLANLKISPAETSRLKNLLSMRSIDMSPDITAHERRAATVMPIIMDIVLEGETEKETNIVVELVSMETPKETVEVAEIAEDEVE